MKIIGLIPARSGSKGLVDKNIVDYQGKPLMAHAINASLESSYINRTIVSTDSIEYANIARKYNAEIPFIRPLDISQDFTQDSEVFIHLIETLNLKEEDIVVQLRPTNPKRGSNLIDKVLEKLINNKLPAIRTISQASFSPYKMVKLNGEKIEPILNIEGKKNGTDLPRQLLPKIYELNGNVDAFYVKCIKFYDSFFPNGTGYYLQQEATADIDHKSDLIKLKNENRNILQ